MNRACSTYLLATCFGVALASTSTGQICASAEAFQGPNDQLAPVDFSPQSSITLSHCYSLPLLLPGLPLGLPAKLLTTFVSVELVQVDSDWGFSTSLSWVDSPESALLAACSLFPVCPAPAVDSCGPAVVETLEYGRFSGSLNAKTAAAGGGFSGGQSYTRIANGEWCLEDAFTVDSPVPQLLEMPIVISGSVYASESFGNPAGTYGRAQLWATGSVFGQPIDASVQVESISVIPEQASINFAQDIVLSVPAGRSTHPFQLSGGARIEVRAESAGLFGTIVGAATAGVNLPNSFRIGRLRSLGGGPLAPGTTVVGALTGAVYETPLAVPSPFQLLPGCHPTASPNGAVLLPLAAGANPGSTAYLASRSGAAVDGFSLLHLGLFGTQGTGCGLVLPGVGEYLLSAMEPPVFVSASAMAAGVATFGVRVPAAQGLLGAQVAFQALLVSGAGLELTTGLVATIGP